MGVWACVHYGVPNKGRLGSGVPHREPSVLHVIVEAVAGDLGASLTEGGGRRRHWVRPPPSLGLEALSCSHEGTLHWALRRRCPDMPAWPEFDALGLRRLDLLGQTRSPSLTACGGSGSHGLRTTHDHRSATRPRV